jgi:hypothetical protein
MFRYPENAEKPEEWLRLMTQLVSTTTSITRFTKHEVSHSTPEMLELWSDVGFLTHSFRYWRYDAKGKEDSLFSLYGFNPIERPKTTENKKLGQGFLLSTERCREIGLDPRTVVEFRQGYLLVSDPRFGTLLIRNSSPKFGRDNLLHPAYWYERALSKDELKTFNPMQDNRFSHILLPDLYQKESNTTSMGYLAKTLLQVKNDYRRWKLDTEAFAGEKFIGDQPEHSPGFAPLVNRLRQWAMLQRLDLEPEETPALAFVNPNFPISEPEATFELTEKHCAQIGGHVDGDWERDNVALRLRRSMDWVKFIQAGIDARAELVMLSPDILRQQGGPPRETL